MLWHWSNWPMRLARRPNPTFDFSHFWGGTLFNFGGLLCRALDNQLIKRYIWEGFPGVMEILNNNKSLEFYDIKNFAQMNYWTRRKVFSFVSHQNAIKNRSFPCNTVGGSKTGKPCSFPFIYQSIGKCVSLWFAQKGVCPPKCGKCSVIFWSLMGPYMVRKCKKKWILVKPNVGPSLPKAENWSTENEPILKLFLLFQCPKTVWMAPKSSTLGQGITIQYLGGLL